ncbi:MAG TPA: hypothetical protein VE954_12220 [Oligoflexus sp.]|uniref:hypothetical protein n=1 Tax=Oligoflexus sp. TaxID=1971216 RepID=UPI002D359D94|nr:hypothetical protein [Oligoflexus sp.]HYX33872.1 hypothetical protein [Oligoflexus sp.]
MLTAQLPSNEEERLKELLEYRILDTMSESAYDELSHLDAGAKFRSIDARQKFPPS